MILYNIITDARNTLIDTNSANYRWPNALFIGWYADMIDIVWDANITQFFDENGDVEKGTYRYSEPHAVSTAYALGDIVHDTNDEMFECTVAGTSGVTAPTFNLGYNATTTDGTVTWTNLERNDIPFPDSMKWHQVAFLIAKAYEIDSTDQNNYQLSQTYMQQFGGML